MAPRRGLSITEVLIAIFIMAIGMISLLALFPIGMIRMSQAIRANRVANAAHSAQSHMETHTVRADPIALQAVTSNAALWGGGAPLFPWNPSATAGQLHTCPVYVDPIGSSLWSRIPANNMAGDPVGRRKLAGETQTPPDQLIVAANLGIPRSFSRHAPARSHRSVLYRWYTLEDEITFTANGLAVASPIERERRISWAYLWRRPMWQEEGVADVSLVLYSNRMIAGLGNANGTANTENVFRQEPKTGGPQGTFNGVAWNFRVFAKNSRRAALVWGNPGGPEHAQPIQPGYWVLDATMLDPTSPLGDGQWHLNGFFYQVVNVGDVDAAGMQEIELDRPAREDGYVAVFPLGIVDVIEKNDGRRP